jgi:hypothetical protein
MTSHDAEAKSTRGTRGLEVNPSRPPEFHVRLPDRLVDRRLPMRRPQGASALADELGDGRRLGLLLDRSCPAPLPRPTSCGGCLQRVAHARLRIGLIAWFAGDRPSRFPSTFFPAIAPSGVCSCWVRGSTPPRSCRQSPRTHATASPRRTLLHARLPGSPTDGSAPWKDQVRR